MSRVRPENEQRRGEQVQAVSGKLDLRGEKASSIPPVDAADPIRSSNVIPFG